MKVKFPVKIVSPTDLRPYFRNTKSHNKVNVVKIANLLKRFGFDQPIVTDANKIIIKGHGRYMAALYLNLKQVPVIIRTDLTPEQTQAARIADNRLFEMGEIDEAMVHSELQEFVSAGGVDGHTVFDFLKPIPPLKESAPKEEKAKATKEAPAMKGTMEVCPRCQHTFWESEQ